MVLCCLDPSPFSGIVRAITIPPVNKSCLAAYCTSVLRHEAKKRWNVVEIRYLYIRAFFHAFCLLVYHSTFLAPFLRLSALGAERNQAQGIVNFSFLQRFILHYDIYPDSKHS